MLQTSKKQTESTYDLSTEIASGAEVLQFLVGFIRRQLPVIIFVALLALALGLIYIMTARPMYTARAQLMIDARKLQVFQQQSILGDIPIDTSQVESQVEVLKSENIAQSVIKNLHLTEDPEFVGSGGGLLAALFDFFSPSESKEAASEFELNRSAVGTLQSRLNVKRLGLTYVIQIEYRSYDAAKSAQIANAVADAYIVDQLEAKYQATRRASVWLQDRIKELRDQVSTAERAVVEFKTKNNIVSTGGAERRLVGEQQVAELNSQLVIARAATAEARARLDRINSVLKSDTPDATVDATVADALKNEVVTKLRGTYLDLAARESDWSKRYGYNHLAVVNIRNQMREIRNSIFEELKRLGETYKSDYEIARQREEGVRKELAHAVAQSQTTNAAQVSLRELESTAQTYKTLYDNFLQRYMESVQQQSFPITEARLISSAARPLEKSHPRVHIILAIAGLGGLIVGFGIGLLRDLSDRVFRTSEQVEDLLQTDCIALVPLLTDAEKGEAHDKSVGATVPGADRQPASGNSVFSKLAEGARSIALISDLRGSVKSAKLKVSSFASSLGDGAKSPAGGFTTAPAKKPNLHGPRTIVHGNNVATRAIVDAPLSRFAEGIRSIKLAADLSGAIKTNRVIGFTSSLPNEGKSTVAIAAAQLMAQVGASTILIDCDLRNPSASRELAPTASTGLLEVVSGKASIDDVLWKDPSTNLAFLPTVAKTRLAHSNEILSSPSVKKIFEQLREKYQYVIVDFSPLAPVVDVRATTHLIDSFVFVIEWGRTKIDIVEHALRHAPGIYDNLLGVVLNKVDMNVFGRFASHRESYYYNKHYARYGYTE